MPGPIRWFGSGKSTRVCQNTASPMTESDGHVPSIRLPTLRRCRSGDRYI
jgi:hypothetical protein